MAVHFNAQSGRLPSMYNEYPIELRLAWQSVRNAYSKLQANLNAPKIEQHEMMNAIKILSARFGMIFDCWYAGLFTEPPEYEAVLQNIDHHEQMLEERP